MILLVFTLFALFENSEILSLRAILDSARFSRNMRINSEDIKTPLRIQLEAKEYYSDGILIENEDLIISGV